MPDVNEHAPHDDDKWNKLKAMMKELPPLRNINAIRAWMTVCRPEMVTVFDTFCKDAAAGVDAPKRLVLYMMIAFAAGRAYQVANPTAPRDPDGYEA